MKYELPPLVYSYDALEPHIDSKTMEIHHAKHHQAYIDKLNGVLEKYPDLQNRSLEDLIANLHGVPMNENYRRTLKNNGGGHLNHSFFWQVIAPKSGGEPIGNASEAIKRSFGSFEKFKEEFSRSALTIFGSGWGWLVVNQNKELKIITTPNQDSPLMDGDVPLLGIDMWEHAFYLKRQNRKNEYVEAFWNVVNWRQVEENYKEAKH